LNVDFLDAPTGWSVDRYAPASFGNIGNYNGLPNAIGLQITSAQGLSSRPYPYNVSFYNTQGYAYAVSGGAGDFVNMALYIPSSWSDASNGSRRTDVWTVLPIAGELPANWGDGIISFTNYGGSARFQVWDNQSGWVGLSTPASYDQWNAFEILLTGSSIDYYINGSMAYSDSEPSTFSEISSVILQGYNFNDPALTGAVANDYTAYWAQAPEPGSMALVSLGVAALAWNRRRRRRAAVN
jgi:hypothetical protein